VLSVCTMNFAALGLRLGLGGGCVQCSISDICSREGALFSHASCWIEAQHGCDSMAHHVVGVIQWHTLWWVLPSPWQLPP
jgi:hypothetical protein